MDGRPIPYLRGRVCVHGRPGARNATRPGSEEVSMPGPMGRMKTEFLAVLANAGMNSGCGPPPTAGRTRGRVLPDPLLLTAEPPSWRIPTAGWNHSHSARSP